MTGDGLLLVVAVTVVVTAAVLFVAAAVLGVALFLRARGFRTFQSRRAIALDALAPYFAGAEGLTLAALEAAGQVGFKAVAEVLRQARREVRGEPADLISRTLVAMGEIDRLESELQSWSRARRAAALRALGECGGERARQLLLESLDDAERPVRSAARDGLLLLEDRSAHSTAIDHFLAEVPDPHGRDGWFYATAAEQAPAELAERLRRGTLAGRHRKLAIEALGDARYAGVVGVARIDLDSPHAELRATAARVLGKLGDRRSRRRLIDLLEDDAWIVRLAAAESLGRVPDSDDGVRQLRRRLRDPEWWVRRMAARGLAEHGVDGWRQLEAELLSSSEESREAALAALSGSQRRPSEDSDS